MSSPHNTAALSWPELQCLRKKGFIKHTLRVTRFSHVMKVDANCRFNQVPFHKGEKVLRIDQDVNRKNLEGLVAVIDENRHVGHFPLASLEELPKPKSKPAGHVRRLSAVHV